ncbi:MAG: hypothetical protein JNM17_38810 [Archangium sp.]|nr:hypothetical protein [Archangium sp.]
MNEDQIRQYSRQILLREVGGVGQKKLLAAPIEIIGWSDAIEVAVTYLSAGGSPIASGIREGVGFLSRRPLPETHQPAIAVVTLPHPDPLPQGPEREFTLQVVIGSEILLRTPTTCAACFEKTRASITNDTPAPVIAGSLGALLLQRHLLGFTEESQRFVWRDGTFQPAQLFRCPEHSNSIQE